MNASRPEPATLDIVAPVFNERDTIDAFVRRTIDALDACPGVRGRVILVNDGSADGSAERIAELRADEPRLALVCLSRNFGHQAALSAGLDAADADAVVLIDADLQDPPELIPELVSAWRDGADVVNAQRRSRAERGVRRLGFSAFHLLFRVISDFPVQRDTGIFGLLDRRAADEMRRLGERNRFLPGLRSWVGFPSATVLYDRDDRAAGEPKQTLPRLIRYAMDGVLSFSYKPLRLMTYAGALVSLTGFSLATFFVTKRLLGIETAGTGFTTLVTLILFMGGAQILALGLVGEYIARIYDEVKARPLYIVGSTAGLSPRPEPPAPTVLVTEPPSRSRTAQA